MTTELETPEMQPADPDDGPPKREAAPGWEKPIGRRAFLGTVLAGLGALVLLSRSEKASQALQQATSAVTPGGQGNWRIYAVTSPMPVFDPKTFRFKVSGLVEEPMELTFDELKEWTVAEKVSDFHCVTGWSVMDVRWRGVDTKEIVERCKPRPEAKYVTMYSLEEPYIDQVTIDQFLHEENLVAWDLDDEPLSREQGSPLRVVLPEMYGYKGVKWVRELSFDSEMQLGYWEQRGYDVDAYVGKSNGA